MKMEIEQNPVTVGFFLPSRFRELFPTSVNQKRFVKNHKVVAAQVKFTYLFDSIVSVLFETFVE